MWHTNVRLHLRPGWRRRVFNRGAGDDHDRLLHVPNLKSRFDEGWYKGFAGSAGAEHSRRQRVEWLAASVASGWVTTWMPAR